MSTNPEKCKVCMKYRPEWTHPQVQSQGGHLHPAGGRVGDLLRSFDRDLWTLSWPYLHFTTVKMDSLLFRIKSVNLCLLNNILFMGRKYDETI